MKSKKILSLLLTGGMTAALLAVPEVLWHMMFVTQHPFHPPDQVLHRAVVIALGHHGVGGILAGAVHHGLPDGVVHIPCFTVSSKTHTWNLVYVDGQWLHVDVSANDLSGRNGVLLVESYQTGKDQAPEATAFLKELFVPGSTK